MGLDLSFFKSGARFLTGGRDCQTMNLHLAAFQVVTLQLSLNLGG